MNRDGDAINAEKLVWTFAAPGDAGGPTYAKCFAADRRREAFDG